MRLGMFLLQGKRLHTYREQKWSERRRERQKRRVGEKGPSVERPRVFRSLWAQLPKAHLCCELTIYSNILNLQKASVISSKVHQQRNLNLKLHSNCTCIDVLEVDQSLVGNEIFMDFQERLSQFGAAGVHRASPKRPMPTYRIQSPGWKTAETCGSEMDDLQTPHVMREM